MVANIHDYRPKIYTGQMPVQELQSKFTDELRDQMKKAALKMGCNVEELKYRVGNDGIVQIARMTADEMIELTAQDAQNKRIIQVKKDRGIFNV